jgi:Ala-tRNA(Pro) deacylase
MPVTKVKEFLEGSGTDYEIIKAPTAYTAQETAAGAHVPGKELAKTVIVKADGAFAMAVLPATVRVDLGLLAGVAGARSVELASEEDFAGLFPDCEVGAMPPFGNLYDMPVFVEAALAKDEKICFYGCDHSQLIKMAFSAYEKLVRPTRGRFSED